MTKHNAISSTLTGVALGLLGLTGAGTGVSFALDCTASTVTSCNKTGCTSRAEQEEPFHFFLDLKRRRLDLSLPEASQAGTVRSVETSNAIALAGTLSPPRQGGRFLSKERDVIAVQIEKTGRTFLAAKNGQVFSGQCE